MPQTRRSMRSQPTRRARCIQPHCSRPRPPLRTCHRPRTRRPFLRTRRPRCPCLPSSPRRSRSHRCRRHHRRGRHRCCRHRRSPEPRHRQRRNRQRPEDCRPWRPLRRRALHHLGSRRRKRRRSPCARPQSRCSHRPSYRCASHRPWRVRYARRTADPRGMRTHPRHILLLFGTRRRSCHNARGLSRIVLRAHNSRRSPFHQGGSP